MPADTGPSFLRQELDTAIKRMRAPELQASLSACRHLSVPVLWGLDLVAFDRTTYQPSSDEGQPALIVSDGPDEDPCDLVACRLGDRRMASRLDNVVALGEERIAEAREERSPLVLYADPFSWLECGGDGAVIVDWSRVGLLFDYIDCVICENRSLAARVHATTRGMAWPPRIRFAHWRIPPCRPTSRTTRQTIR